MRRRRPRRQDLSPVGVVLAPEGGAPCLVQRLDVAVALLQPDPERGRADVAVAPRHVAAELVPDVPQRERRVPGVALGEPLHQREGVLPVHRRARAVGLPAAGPQSGAVGRHRQRLRVAVGQPGRGRGGRGGQVDGDATLVQQVENLVQPTELEATGFGFEQRPGEHPDGGHGDAGRPHQPDVLGPDGFRPLLRVVVAAEAQPGRDAGQRAPGRRRTRPRCGVHHGHTIHPGGEAVNIFQHGLLAKSIVRNMLVTS